MIVKEEKIPGVGVVDTDTENRLMDINNIRKLVNCYIHEPDGASSGSLKIEKGNELVVVELPTGENKVIGEAIDIANTAIVYCIWNENEQHSVVRYYVLTGAHQIKTDPLFNFQKNKKVFGANIIEGLFYFTDGWFDEYRIQSNGYPGYNPPRKVNLDKMFSNEYPSFDFQTLDRIKYPPWKAPTAVYEIDANRSSNFLWRQLFQFRYRYKYDDLEYSVWSPISKTEIPIFTEDIGGRIPDDPTNGNVLRIAVDTGHHTVTEIEVAFRVGNIRPFGTFKTINKSDEGLSDNQEYTFLFYNDQTRDLLSGAEEFKLFDRVAQVVGDQYLVQENKLVDANLREGYDSLDDGEVFDIDLTVMKEGLGVPELPSLFDVQLFQVVAGTWYMGFGISETNQDWVAGDIIQLKIIDTTGGLGDDAVPYVINYLIQEDDEGVSAQTLSDRVVAHLINEIDDLELSDWQPGASESGYWVRKFLFNTPTAINGGWHFATERIIRWVPNVRSLTFKSGDEVEIGFVYRDRALRQSTVVWSAEKSKAYIPFHTEENAYAGQIANAIRKNWIKLIINHTPPIWADTYTVVARFSKRILNYQWRTGIGGQLEGSRFRIKLENFYLNRYIGATINHTPQQGDVVRIITKKSVSSLNSPFPAPAGTYYFAEDYLELTVMQYDIETNSILVEEFTPDDYGLHPEMKGVLMEIYTPKTQDEDGFWYEISREFEIQNPHTSSRVHLGQYIDQGTGTNTGGIPRIDLKRGNAYIRLRTYGINEDNENKFTHWVEDPHYSDYYASDFIDIGRVQEFIPTWKNQHLKTALRSSNVYVQNTQVNGLSTFDAGDFEHVMDRHGEIRRIVEVGFTLKVLQKSKSTSFYLNRSELFDQGDGSSLFASTKFFGVKRPQPEDWGISHAEGLIHQDRLIFYPDCAVGHWIMDGANGQHPISDNGFKNETNRLFDAVKAVTDRSIRIYGGYDKRNELATWSFVDEDLDPSVPGVAFEEITVGYNHLAKSWRWHYWTSEYFSKYGDQFFVFKDGALYIANSDNVPRLQFFGEKQKATVVLIGSQHPGIVKRFMSMAVKSNKPWDVSEVIIHPSGNFPNGMSSRINKDKFKAEEGIYYAPFERDILTPNVSFPIANGRELRGQTVEIKLENDDDSEVTLFGVNIITEISEPSNV